MPAADTSANGYLQPPVVTTVAVGNEGVTVTGTARPKASVRLGSPNGEAVTVRADGEGRWTIPLPPAGEARIYGVSLTSDGRAAQAEGYLLIGPNGQAATLRAGAGAVRLDRGKALRVSAIDFDRDGGALVSGEAPAGAALAIRFDGTEAAQGRANAQGRFSISLPTPAQPGVHQVQVFDGGMSDSAQVTVSDAETPTSGPVRAQTTPEGLRIDWMTPGGGVQSTLLTP